MAEKQVQSSGAPRVEDPITTVSSRDLDETYGLYKQDVGGLGRGAKGIQEDGKASASLARGGGWGSRISTHTGQEVQWKPLRGV